MKLASMWHDFATPFDRTNPQYACHVHGYDARTRNTMKAAVGLLIVSFLTQWGGWFMPGMVLFGCAGAVLFIGLFSLATDGACFPSCTCQTQSSQEVPHG